MFPTLTFKPLNYHLQIKKGKNKMLNDWNFWFSIITAVTAIIAVFLSWKQTRLSNKQQLFERRLNAHMVVAGLIELYKTNRERLEKIDWSEPQLANDFEFSWLTNNSYMEQHIEVMNHPLEQPYQKEFLKKLEELRLLAKEIQLIFTGKEIIMYADFVIAYQELLFKMYRYQIIIDKIEKENENNPTELNVLQTRFGEEKYRNELRIAMEKLSQTYIMIVNNDVDNKMKKQIRLK